MSKHHDMGDYDYKFAGRYVANMGKPFFVDGEKARAGGIVEGKCPCCGHSNTLRVKRAAGNRGHEALVLRCDDMGTERALMAAVPMTLDD